MSRPSRWVRPLGSAAADGWEVAVTGGGPYWHHTSLHVANLPAGGVRTLEAADWEHVVVPLAGGVHVTAETFDGGVHEARLAGRPDVFAGPTDTAYAPSGSRITLRAAAGPARIAVAGALVPGGATGSPGGHPFRHTPAASVPVERRGAGQASRHVRNFGTPGVLAADALIACEVLTAAGNWSSWPPHKHDTERPGEETALEEVYYFETRAAGGGTGGTDPVGYQRVYASERGRPIDVLAEVRTGDVVLVPYGWHGPSIAAPDADLYYLNVMAGPGPERAWLIRDDPAHATTRTTWPTQPFDPRLGPTTRSAPGDPAAPDPTDHADGPRTADPSDRTHAADPADPAAPGDGSAGPAGPTPPNDDPAPGGAV